MNFEEIDAKFNGQQKLIQKLFFEFRLTVKNWKEKLEIEATIIRMKTVTEGRTSNRRFQNISLFGNCKKLVTKDQLFITQKNNWKTLIPQAAGLLS